MWDHTGRRYLDFSSQRVTLNIGHQHPSIVQASIEQVGSLATVAPSTVNLARSDAKKRIVDRAPAQVNEVFFTNGGAIENAMRMARMHTGRDKVPSAYLSHHFNTGAAVVATGDWRRIPNEFAPAHVHFIGPFLYRSEFWATTPEQDGEGAFRHFERMIQSEGPPSIAAVLLESVPGTAGILIPSSGYLAGVQALFDRYGVLLILDEAMEGTRWRWRRSLQRSMRWRTRASSGTRR